VKSGDKVLISANGVQVNGKERSSQIFWGFNKSQKIVIPLTPCYEWEEWCPTI
jgi:hypothetical protein